MIALEKPEYRVAIEKSGGGLNDRIKNRRKI